MADAYQALQTSQSALGALSPWDGCAGCPRCSGASASCLECGNEGECSHEKELTSGAYSAWGADWLAIDLPSDRSIPFVCIRESWGVRIRASRGRLHLEFNPSRPYSKRLHPCPVELLPEVLQEVTSRLRPLIGAYAPEDLGDAVVARLDLTRDFEGVTHRAAIIEGLRGVPRYRRLRTRVYANEPIIWGPNSIVLGTDEQAAIYDRHLLDRSIDGGNLIARRYGSTRSLGIPEGVLRFEVRARKSWLAQFGMQRLGMCSAEVATAALLDRWNWARFGFGITRATDFLASVSRQTWTEREKADHFWIESNRLAGVAVPLAGRRRSRHVARVSALGMPAPLAEAASVRLDLWSGRECST